MSFRNKVGTALRDMVESLGPSETKSTIREILNIYWNELFRSVVENLHGKTLEALCDEHKRMQNQIMYYI